MTAASEPPVAGREPALATRGPRVALVLTLAVLFTLVLSLRAIATTYTDYAWFDQLGRGDVWTTAIGARLGIAIVAGLITFAIVLTSLTIAERLAPSFRFQGPEDEITHRFRSVTAPFAGRLRAAIAGVFALAVASNAAAGWKDWLLFNHAVDFGVRDPQFDRDVGFYVFRLPFIASSLSLLFGVLLVTFVVTLAAHYLNGGIRFQAPYSRVTPQVKAHVSVLLAIMAIVKTAQYWFERYELVFSKRGVRQGALYTDVKVQLPAYNLLVIIALLSAALFVVNIWRRGWALPVIAVVMWGFVSIVVGQIVPAATQKFSVENSVKTKERPYIQRNIDATRDAFGIADVSAEPIDVSSGVDGADVAAGAEVLETVRLWDPGALRGQFNEQQSFRRYYAFNDLDVDRYRFGSEIETVIIGVRELTADLPSESWITRHLVYTHGSGVVVASGDAVTQRNATYRLSGIPPEGQPEVAIDPDRTGIYFGEGLEPFVVANSREQEVEGTDEDAGGDVQVRYEGAGGVPVGGFFTKAALALRFWDRNLFLSSSVTADSRVLWVRDPAERVQKVAPFLSIDADPYPAVIDGRVVWIVDGYTTTNRYPYSQSMRLDNSGLDLDFNYVRSSVKATVDAYDGTVRLYAWDTEDPILRAWMDVFPGLVADRSELSADIEAHLRYPTDLFQVQTRRFAEYHVTDADTFFDGEQTWQIAQTSTQPIASGGGSVTSTTAPVIGPDGGESTRAEVVPDRPADPIYQQIQLPGEDEPEFVLTQSYVPSGRQNVLRALVFARSDPGHYGELVVGRVDGSVLSPLSAGQRVQNDPRIAAEISLLNDQGSQLNFGEMRMVPLGDGLLYVQPFFIRGEGDSAFFTLHGVAVSDGERAVLEPSFDAALAGLFADGPDPDDPDPGDATVAELLQRAADAFAAADEAAADGDYEEQGRQLARARRLVDQALEAADTATASEDPSADDPASDDAGPDDEPGSSTTASTTTAAVGPAALVGA